MVEQLGDILRQAAGALPTTTSSRNHQTPPEPYECPHCKSLVKPFWVDWAQRWVSPACECSEDRLIAARVQAEQEAKQRRTQRLFSLSQLEGRFSDATFSTWQHSPRTEHAFKAAREYVDRWSERRAAGDGLMFVGDVGTGKTRLAASIVRALVERDAAAVFQSVPSLLTRIRATYGSSGERESQLLEVLMDADLVVLDDIGVEKVNDWVLDRLYVIIDSRYLRRAPIIVTSNLMPDELADRIGQRLVDRLVEMCKPIRFAGESERHRRAQERRTQ
jgi:DNA replication protein DnaC